jgi:NDP-sugar pyrophosphorylase family protein
MSTKGFWSKLSSPEDLLQINKLVIDRIAKTGRTDAWKSVSGAKVSPLALVYPRAMLGKCTIGDYTVVAEGARVMDGAEVSHAVVCRNATIGNGVYLNHVLVRPEGIVKAGGRYGGTERRVLILPDEG